MTKKLIWRLKEQPSTESLRELVHDKLLTNEEAREILFSSEEVEKRDVKSLEAEVKFLRDLVEKLSKDREQIVRIVETVKPIYIKEPWYQPYYYWCGNGINLYATTTIAGSLSGTATSQSQMTNCTSNSQALGVNGNGAFSSIQTF